MLSDTVLVITAWKRPEYLRTTLAFWQAAGPHQLREVAVALGRSHRHDDMMDVITEAERSFGKRIHVIPDSSRAERSPGMHRALGEAIDTAFGQLDAKWVLLGEEDVIVSDDALPYVAWAQKQAAENTLCICLHNKGGTGWDGLTEMRQDGDADQAAVRRLGYFNPWGWCISWQQWVTVARPVWDWDCDSGGEHESGYDWQMSRLASQGPWHCLVPDAARSQTIGEELGVYSNPDIFPLQQAKSFAVHREDVAYRLVEADVDRAPG